MRVACRWSRRMDEILTVRVMMTSRSSVRIVVLLRLSSRIVWWQTLILMAGYVGLLMIRMMLNEANANRKIRAFVVVSVGSNSGRAMC